jgi:hypothetical protein
MTTHLQWQMILDYQRLCLHLMTHNGDSTGGTQSEGKTGGQHTLTPCRRHTASWAMPTPTMHSLAGHMQHVSMNIPCWYQGCALDFQEDRSLELISHGSVKVRSMNECNGR